MKDNNTLAELSGVLTAADLAVVSTSLWQDAILWQALQQPGLAKKIAQSAQGIAAWTPAQLALAMLDANVTSEALRTGTDETLDGDLVQRANAVYDAFINGRQCLADLQTAGLIALALRERNRLGVSWAAIFDRNNAYYPLGREGGDGLLRTTLTVLYGLTNDPDVLLRAWLAAHPEASGLEWACHCVLTNPLPTDRMCEVMAGLLLDLSLQQQLDWLRWLCLKGFGELAAALGQTLSPSEAGSEPIGESEDFLPFAEIARRVDQLQQAAALHTHAGQKPQAIALLKAARAFVEQNLAGIQIQLARMDETQDYSMIEEAPAAWQRALQSPWLAAEACLGQQNRPWDDLIAAAGEEASAFVLLRQARLLDTQGERSQAQQIGRLAVSRLPKMENTDPALWGTTGTEWRPVEVVDQLVDLGLIDEAAQVADANLKIRRMDVDLLDRAAQVFEQQGKLLPAIEAAQMVCLLEPSSPNSLRRLAGLYERAGEWKNALTTRQSVLALQNQPGTDDRLHVANCALYADSLGGVMEICEQVLAIEPDQGSAHGLLGLALLRQGDREHAVEHLQRATILAPEEARAWLALADIQREDSDAQLALETLHAAVLAAPESAELNYALAKCCLESDQPSEALPFLWEAARLDAGQAEVAWRLARTLHSLGHTREAREVIDQARWRWPEHAMTAALDAEMLLESGRLEQAIAPLEVALAGEAPQPEWRLLHARALLGLKEGVSLSEIAEPDRDRLLRAYASLNSAVEALPGSVEARVLLAEVLYQQGSSRAAYDLYRSLAENKNANDGMTGWRVQAGLGRSAMALDEIETAVAALGEATHNHPQDVRLQQDLAEAYHKVHLTDEAVQAARQALVLDTENVDNLSWFIDVMTRLGRSEETLSALEAVTRLAPEKAAFWNKLARVHVRSAQRGSENAAKEALETLQSIADVSCSDLRSAARTYLLLGEREAALGCITRAIEVEEDYKPDLHYAAAALHFQRGEKETALTMVRDAVVTGNAPAEASVMLADVLGWLGKHEEALTTLESLIGEERVLVKQPTPVDDLLPETWREAALLRGSILARMAVHALDLGDSECALHTAAMALEIQPGDALTRLLVAELERAQSNSVHAMQNASGIEGEPYDDGADSIWEQALVAIQTEIALENGEDTSAARLIEENIRTIPAEAHLLAVQARLLQRMGDHDAALSALEEISKSCASSQLPGRENLLQASDLHERVWQLYQNSSGLSVAEARLDLSLWDEALEKFACYTVANPGEARGHLRRARALVVCAEEKRLCTALRCEKHVPFAHSQSEQMMALFESSINAAEQLAGENPEVLTWKMRGQAAFQPTLQIAPALAKLPATPGNAAALIGLLHTVKNAPNAVRIAHHYPEDSRTLVHLALCYKQVDALKGLDCARKAVEKNQRDPLAFAAEAMLEQDCGDIVAALTALETGLGFWPDEPGWHAWSAELRDLLGDEDGTLQSWERALTLDADNTQYGLVVAEKQINLGNAERAIAVLEHASEVDPQSAAIWTMLSESYRMIGQMDEALKCASQAAEITPHEPEAYLVSGAIALQMGKPEIALEYARTALECNPRHPEAVLFVSKVLVQKGQLAEGLAVLEKSAAVLRESLPVMLERANLIRRLYGAQVALPVFLELAQLFPQEPAVLSLLAQAQSECGDLKAAERTAYSAHHINPEDPRLNFLLGRLQHASGQLDQAIHFLSEAIRQSPNEIEPYLELGQAYLDRREHLQALLTYQQAIKVSGQDHRPFYRAALVLRDSKDYIGAEAMLRRAAELAPEDLNIRRQLGAVVALNLVHNTQEVNSPL